MILWICSIYVKIWRHLLRVYAYVCVGDATTMSHITHVHQHFDLKHLYNFMENERYATIKGMAMCIRVCVCVRWHKAEPILKVSLELKAHKMHSVRSSFRYRIRYYGIILCSVGSWGWIFHHVTPFSLYLFSFLPLPLLLFLPSWRFIRHCHNRGRHCSTFISATITFTESNQFLLVVR